MKTLAEPIQRSAQQIQRAAKREARRMETAKACSWLADSMQRELDEMNAVLRRIESRCLALEKARGMHE